MTTGNDDFDGTAQTVIYPADADEATPISEILVPIPLVDDNINEPVDGQVFIVNLQVTFAANFSLLMNDIQNKSFCAILDDDGKLPIIIIAILKLRMNTF